MSSIDFSENEYRDLVLLQEIEADPDVSQADLAAGLGVAIGTVNWHIKRLVDKGLIKVKRARRRKLRYIITPDGIALRAKLTMAYIKDSFRLFRQVRSKVIELLSELEHAGINRVGLIGEGDVAEVCRLTCMEQRFIVTDNLSAPALVVNGLDIELVNEPEKIRSMTEVL